MCKRWLDVHLRPQNQSFRVSNNESGIREILTHLRLPEAVGRIILESTGGYERQLALALSILGSNLFQGSATSSQPPCWHCCQQMQGKRTIFGGRAAVRQMLYMATLVAVRHNPVTRVFYDRLLAKGKATKVALVDCMHKLLTILNAMIKNGTDWQLPNSDVTQSAVPSS